MSAIVLQVMREWADAIRGDWSDIDGRSVKCEINDWVAALEGVEPQASWSLDQWRSASGLCPRGGGHWVDHCRTLSCGEAQA